ncbi:hypothetical protein F3Y22_tig00110044pilonHSYRG00165 [Hibiscus syriacus]|uniref:F-box domain-containing protein n=1 Tax=Hibiscus syriacus TaxID=106335 RepID=A0A6A3BNC4_HIBSY|nr:hypothetical protein F3Y22_tig00110044pilonHSYRG00165 [Hibiscus syriacus]
MENQSQGSAPSHPNHRLDPPSYELHSPVSNEQSHRPESPHHESRSRSRNASLSPQSIPEEIIIEILSDLPVKSLLRFGCVSKSWKSLISDPFFIRKHLKRIQNDRKFSEKRVLIKTACSGSPFIIGSFPLNAIHEDPFVKATRIECPLERSYRSIKIVGSCDGLICIAIREDAEFLSKYTLFLLNPALRVSKRLPDLNCKTGICLVYGFGFDASKDDYKVVRVCSHPDKAIEDGYKSIVDVYSSRTNRWRRIHDFPFRVSRNEGVKHVDGTLNWSVYGSRKAGFPFTIISLDLARETYDEVMQPCYGGGGVGERTLGVLDGCLCVLCHHACSYADVWVMKEYGKTASWTKLITISYAQHLRFCTHCTPSFTSVSDEILLCFGATLVVYNPKEDKLRVPRFPDKGFTLVSRAEVYEESLVSPIVIDRHR